MDNEILKKIGSANPNTANSEEDISDLIDQMPPHVKGVYFATSTADEIYKATQESGMPEDFMPKAGFLLGDVLLGILNPENFTHELMNFGVPEVAAANFYRLISQSIFLKIKDELNQMYNLEPTSTEKPAIMPASSPLPEPRQTQPEPSQEEGEIIRIKVEPPPLRRVNVHHFEEEKESVPQQKIQPKINDPYREPVGDSVDPSGNTNS